MLPSGWEMTRGEIEGALRDNRVKIRDGMGGEMVRSQNRQWLFRYRPGGRSLTPGAGWLRAAASLEGDRRDPEHPGAPAQPRASDDGHGTPGPSASPRAAGRLRPLRCAVAGRPMEGGAILELTGKLFGGDGAASS